MRIMIAALAVCFSTAALAQNAPPAAPPPTVGGKPLLQVKPRAAAAKPQAAKPQAAKPQAAKPQSMAAKLQACLDTDDGTKERLNCYDAIIPPKPKAKAGAAKGVADCKFMKEEDERLACFNGFAEKIPKLGN